MREKIVQAALTWVDTPYHHQARVKGVGVDCAHFIAGVAIDAGLLPANVQLPFDYSPEWNLHNSEEKLVNYLLQFGCTEKEVAEPGDILAFKIGKAIGHVGILLPNSQYVHAQNMTKPERVTVNTLSGTWLKRHTRTFSFPGA
jgi:NlpC/P60 family putative phage cell wall peptidase